ncbi:hypothetical protein [Georgenia sp. AZ-5]|uniref:hypothetical protein n=1 Tax=Georgenia sp. AZ-5 TaxID=3367526 RepID=UPI003753EE0E
MRGTRTLVLGAALLLAGCATAPADEAATRAPQTSTAAASPSPSASPDRSTASPAGRPGTRPEDVRPEDVEVTVTDAGAVQDEVAALAHTRLHNPSDVVAGVSLVVTGLDAAGDTVATEHNRTVLQPGATAGLVTLLGVPEGVRVSTARAEVTVQTVSAPADPPESVTAEDLTLTYQRSRRFVTGIDNHVSGRLVSTVPERLEYVRLHAICSDDAGTVVAAGTTAASEPVSPDEPVPFDIALVGGPAASCEITATPQ